MIGGHQNGRNFNQSNFLSNWVIVLCCYSLQHAVWRITPLCSITEIGLSIEWVTVIWQPVECLYARYNRLSNRLYNPFWQPVLSCKQTSNRLWNQLYNRLYNRLNEQSLFVQPVVKPGCTTGLTTGLTTGCIHGTADCQTGCQTGLTTGWMFVYTIQPVVKNRFWQQVVSCKRGLRQTVLCDMAFSLHYQDHCLSIISLGLTRKPSLKVAMIIVTT